MEAARLTSPTAKTAPWAARHRSSADLEQHPVAVICKHTLECSDADDQSIIARVMTQVKSPDVRTRVIQFWLSGLLRDTRFLGNQMCGPCDAKKAQDAQMQSS